MIIDFRKLDKIREKYKGKTIVLGSGVFDLLHFGHINYIKRLKKYGDIVVVMVKSDKRVNKGKGPLRPIISETDRAGVINAIKDVDYVFISPPFPFVKGDQDPTYEAVFKKLKPDIFCTDNPVWKILKKINKTKVIIFRSKRKPLHSTTKIIEHILDRYK